VEQGAAAIAGPLLSAINTENDNGANDLQQLRQYGLAEDTYQGEHFHRADSVAVLPDSWAYLFSVAHVVTLKGVPVMRCAAHPGAA
jgi:hypothetical protein